MALQEKYFTVQEAANELDVTEGRIRQILTRDAPAKDERIGRKFGYIWALSQNDLRQIGKFIKKNRQE